MPGQAREADAARFQMDEEQDVVGGETSPGEHFDGEQPLLLVKEVDGFYFVISLLRLPSVRPSVNVATGPKARGER